MADIRIRDRFLEVGIEEVRPSDTALAQMGLSRKRFSQLIDNLNKTEITVKEFEGITRWLQGIKELNAEHFIGDDPGGGSLADRLNMSM